MWITRLTVSAALGLCLAGPAWAHNDVVPKADPTNSRLITGGHDDITGTSVDREQVFGFDFGEDPTDPFNIGDPGFNSPSGSLPMNAILKFNVLQALKYWDGTGNVSFAPAPADVSLGLIKGGSHVTITGATGLQPGLTIGSTGALGGLHVHLTSQLNSTDGTDPAAPNAPDGIYLVELGLILSPATLSDADPIFIVYNNNSDDVHQQAIDWVQANLVAVPEPSGIALLAIGLAGCMGLRWRLIRRRKATGRGCGGCAG